MTLAEDAWQKVARHPGTRSPEFLMLHFLNRLNGRRPFLQQIQGEGGDVSLILLVERESSADFTLPASVSRLLAQLDVTVEFRFA
jgi:hypothetical protein